MLRRLLVVVMLLGTGHVATAQDSVYTPIAYGETAVGEVSAEAYRALFAFDGRAGDVVTIGMRATEGDLDPYLVLVNEFGRGVAFSDDEGVGNSALIEAQRLAEDGRFFIIATRFGHEQGSTTGFFEITLSKIGSATPSGSALQYGDSVIGQIQDVEPQSIYYFFGQRGDVVNVRMIRTSGNLDAWIDLADADGRILISGDDDPSAVGSLDAGIVNFRLPETGAYIIQATRYGNITGNTSGSFVLSVDSIPITERGRSFSDAVLLDYGGSLAGSIDDEVPQLFYTFEGLRGDAISINMQRTAGNLDVVMILLNSQQQELARDDFGIQRAEISNYLLPETGIYYIMITREDFSEGQTEGDFEIDLAGRSSLQDGTVEVFYEASIIGTIDDNVPFQTYTFEGEAGDFITIRMDATSGDLDALLTLFQDDKQIAFDDDGGEGTNAAIVSFRLPEDGEYRIEASRWNRFEGETSGSYELTLEQR